MRTTWKQIWSTYFCYTSRYFLRKSLLTICTWLKKILSNGISSVFVKSRMIFSKLYGRNSKLQYYSWFISVKLDSNVKWNFLSSHSSRFYFFFPHTLSSLKIVGLLKRCLLYNTLNRIKTMGGKTIVGVYRDYSSPTLKCRNINYE